jgi:hypothetical protein
MASLDELIRQKLRLQDDIERSIVTSAERAQGQAWRAISGSIQELDVDADGNIAQTQKNVRLISEIVNRLSTVLAGGEYRDAVSKFIGQLDENFELTNEIARTVDRTFEPTAVAKELQNIAKQNAVTAFFSSGIRDRVIQPFLEQLYTSVATRAPLNQTVTALRTVVEGDPNVDGRVLANVRTIAGTAQAVADNAYAAQVYEQVGFEWFRWAGGEIETTRPFCQARHGNVYHRKEIEAWGDGKNAGGHNDIRKGTWEGRIEGTDSKTIFTNRGGWNCRHTLVPVLARNVPADVRARARAEGFID